MVESIINELNKNPLLIFLTILLVCLVIGEYILQSRIQKRNFTYNVILKFEEYYINFNVELVLFRLRPRFQNLNLLRIYHLWGSTNNQIVAGLNQMEQNSNAIKFIFRGYEGLGRLFLKNHIDKNIVYDLIGIQCINDYEQFEAYINYYRRFSGNTIFMISWQFMYEDFKRAQTIQEKNVRFRTRELDTIKYLDDKGIKKGWYNLLESNTFLDSMLFK